MQIEEALPCRLANGTLKTSSPYSRERLRWTTAISGWQRLKWQHHLICRARGEYRLWPPRLRTGDMFGLFPQEMILSGSESLLVYPRILSDSRLHLALTEFLGEREKTSRLYEDLSRPIGPRDYRPQDPFKRIHWKATARQGELQVKQFESSTGQNLLVLLDVRSFCEPKRQDEETFELAVSTAASITHELHGAGWPVGLIANAIPEIEIPVSSDRSQIRSILEALARVGQTPAGPLHALLERERVRSYPGTLFVIVTRDPSPSLVSVMRDIRKQGYSLFLVTFGNGPPEASLGGIPVFRASEQSPSPGSSEAVG